MSDEKLYAESDVTKLLDLSSQVAERWRGLLEERNAEWQEAEAKLQKIEELLKLDSCSACTCGECDFCVEGSQEDCDCIVCEIWRVIEHG